jgi:uncharacterized protein YdeI (YjbR/CyaY-like superfamily)
VEPQFFATPEELRAWFECHHDVEDELLAGFWKRATGKRSITWEQSRDEALCFGWIDGVRRGLDDESYSIRFTPRRPNSIWSAVNIERFAALDADGRVTDAGRAAFSARREDRSRVYSYEGPEPELGPGREAELRAVPGAWGFFSEQPPWYRRAAAHWVVSAKREETRERRLRTLVADSAERLRVKHLRR